MRTIVDIPPEQLRHLDAYAAAERVSRAEAVRRAVEFLLAARDAKRKDWLQALDEARGAWRRDDAVSDSDLEAIRDEWDRDVWAETDAPR